MRLLASPSGRLGHQRATLQRGAAQLHGSAQPGRARPARRRAAPAAAAADGASASSSTAAATVERCMQHFASCNLDGLIEHLPDALVDRVLASKRHKMWVPITLEHDEETTGL